VADIESAVPMKGELLREQLGDLVACWKDQPGARIAINKPVSPKYRDHLVESIAATDIRQRDESVSISENVRRDRKLVVGYGGANV
jgi:hypothetical protein